MQNKLYITPYSDEYLRKLCLGIWKLKSDTAACDINQAACDINVDSPEQFQCRINSTKRHTLKQK